MGVDLLDQMFEWRCRDLVGRGWHFYMPGHRLILRPMSKPGGTLPARYTHCCICACPCSACCGFRSLLWGEYKLDLTWLDSNVNVLLAGRNFIVSRLATLLSWLWLTVTRWFRRVGSWGLACVIKRSNECTVSMENPLIANGVEISGIDGFV
jgi:hypothetical protein